MKIAGRSGLLEGDDGATRDLVAGVGFVPDRICWEGLLP
jgi:hypothetical protein